MIQSLILLAADQDPVMVAPITVTSSLQDSILDWLTAIGTVGAVIVALLIAWNERRKRRVEREERQARLISAWADADLIGVSDPGHCRNSSEMPILDVRISGGYPGHIKQGMCLLPGETLVFPVKHKFTESHVLCIDFTDANSIRWRRHMDGRLERLKHPTNPPCAECVPPASTPPPAPPTSGAAAGSGSSTP